MRFWACACGGGGQDTSSVNGSSGSASFSAEESCRHEYVLSEDGETYVCELCGDAIASGKGEIPNEEAESPGLIIEEEIDLKSYLFLGSSITNGYDPTVENPALDSSHYSMADMFGEDYLEADYRIYRDGMLRKEENVYMRKIANAEQNADGVGGTYRFDYDTVILNGDGTGDFNGTDFEYTVVGDEIRLVKPVGYLYGFSAVYGDGDIVYKYARDGFTLSYAEERYTESGEKIENSYRQSYVGLLKEAIEKHRDDEIDTMFVQLSTNDIGQYKTPAGAAGEHLDFGSVSEDDVRDPEQFDLDTSFGRTRIHRCEGERNVGLPGGHLHMSYEYCRIRCI